MQFYLVNYSYKVVLYILAVDRMSFSQRIGGNAVTLHMHIEGVAKDFTLVVTAGAAVVKPVMDMFWGNRY